MSEYSSPSDSKTDSWFAPCRSGSTVCKIVAFDNEAAVDRRVVDRRARGREIIERPGDRRLLARELAVLDDLGRLHVQPERFELVGVRLVDVVGLRDGHQGVDELAQRGAALDLCRLELDRGAISPSSPASASAYALTR